MSIGMPPSDMLALSKLLFTVGAGGLIGVTFLFGVLVIVQGMRGYTIRWVKRKEVME